jgi:ATP-binding cassette subfamily F protein 3
VPRLILDEVSSYNRFPTVGKNGVGKTTLLKAIAAFEVENMPRHHRILHVRQEIQAAGGDISVLQAVIDADVERNTLIEEEKNLLKRLEGDGIKTDDEVSKKAKLDKLKALSANDVDAKFNADIKRLDEVYERLQILGADAAESRAGMILTGLQFTPTMQNGPTSALSGGWRMRVALAAALFIEPVSFSIESVSQFIVVPCC